MLFKNTKLKFVLIIMIIFLVLPTLSSCKSTQKRDADYLYDWLTQHGTLVNGTCLEYTGMGKDGTTFSISYNTVFVEAYRWNVWSTSTDSSRRTIDTRLVLFGDSKEASCEISVSGSGTFDAYARCLDFYHVPTIFTNKSPIEMGMSDGSTVVYEIFKAGQGPVTIVDDTEGLQEELNTMDDICYDNAHKNLCEILDWLKDSFCARADMTMSDFGYEKY